MSQAPPGNWWVTFLRNHAPEIWACDFLPITNLLFRPVYAFFVIALGSRRVVHVGVTRHPTDVWVAQQLREATPFDQRPQYLVRDNDSKYGRAFAHVAEGFTHETVRDWEARFAPLLTAHLRTKRRGLVGGKWHVDETYVQVDGQGCYLSRAIGREGDLVEAMLGETRAMAAARCFFAQALAVVGHAPGQVTMDGHGAYPRAIREAFGAAATHRTSRYNNNGIEQDHPGIKQRSSPLRGFGSCTSAARFCPAFEEQRQYFRAPARSREPVSLAERRERFQQRWAALLAEVVAA